MQQTALAFDLDGTLVPMLVFNISIFNSATARERIFNALSQRENVWL